MRFLLIALTFLTATTALGQTATLTLQGPNNSDTVRVPQQPCDFTRSVTWAITGSFIVCGDLKFWLTKAGSCPETPASTDKEIDVVTDTELRSGTLSGTVTFETGELPGFKGGGGELDCPAADREDSYQLCASVKQSTLSCSNNDSSYLDESIEVVYDAKPPSAPTIAGVAGLDKALSVRVTAPDDANRVRVRVERADGTGSARNLEQSSEQPQFRVEGLENNVTYRITARAVDEADNESAPSEAQEGMPILTRGFFDRYVDAHGAEMGGCGAAGGLAGGWVLAVLGFWLSSRRNRS